MRRRRMLTWLGAQILSGGTLMPASAAMAAAPRYPAVVPGYHIRFPEDEGSHPAFRTEWWYITGWLEPSGRAPLGFQITFFRARGDLDEANPSAFAARQVMIAHAALSDASRGRLAHDQKLARAAFDLAGAQEGRVRVWIDDWSLVQEREGSRAEPRARAIPLVLTLARTLPPPLQRDN